MIDAWRRDAQIIWAAKRTRPSGFAALYYRIMRRVVGLHEMPANGADCLLVDSIVVDAFRSARKAMSAFWRSFHGSDFVRCRLSTTRSHAWRARPTGRSRVSFDWLWTRFRHSQTCRSEGAGTLGRRVSSRRFCLHGAPYPNCRALAAMIGLTGVQWLAVGVVGQYVWRALEEVRRRPQYLIERPSGVQPVALAADT
jgi:hypothetical protein